MKKIDLNISNQPDHTSCGPTSLYTIYRYWDQDIELKKVIEEISQFDQGGGTLAVILASHALNQGYDISLYSYNLKIFDPSWFSLDPQSLVEKLKIRRTKKENTEKDIVAIDEYIEVLNKGGTLLFENLSETLIASYLNQDIPVLAGLSSTWLYQSMREDNLTCVDDDLFGDQAGHFVILHGYDKANKMVYVADPYKLNPISGTNYYVVDMTRLINSILLGVATYDGNLLVIRPKKEGQ